MINDMAVTQYNPEKLFEKMENNFVQALQKVCKQQADMFASKMEIMENFYRNSVKDTKNLDISADHSEVTGDNYLLTGNAVINSVEYYLERVCLGKSNGLLLQLTT
jgi:hypothetical protein